MSFIFIQSPQSTCSSYAAFLNRPSKCSWERIKHEFRDWENHFYIVRVGYCCRGDVISAVQCKQKMKLCSRWENNNTSVLLSVHLHSTERLILGVWIFFILCGSVFVLRLSIFYYFFISVSRRNPKNWTNYIYIYFFFHLRRIFNSSFSIFIIQWTKQNEIFIELLPLIVPLVTKLATIFFFKFVIYKFILTFSRHS